MKINSVSNHFQEVTLKPVEPKRFAEYVQDKQKTDAEIKVVLEKIDQEMVELKSLLSQIAAIRCNKDVS